MTTYHTLQDIHRTWLPCNPSITKTTTTSSAANINPYHLPTFANSTPPSPSEPQVLNNLASCNLSQGSRFTATILPHDSQSFVTDTPQRWLTQPQPPRLPTPAVNTSNSNSNQASNEQFVNTTHNSTSNDFVLFPTVPSSSSPIVSSGHADPEWKRARAISNTAPNQYIDQAQDGFQSRYNSPHQQAIPISVAPIQNRRVSGIIYGTGSRSSSQQHLQQHHNSPIEQQHLSYANSAPASTTTLQQQLPQSRPPVPNFPRNSTGFSAPPNTSMMAHPPHSEGTSFFEDAALDPESMLTTSPSGFPSDDMLDFNNFQAQAPEAHLRRSHTLDYTTDFIPVNPPASADARQTVSPHELMLQPPSATFTDLSTPATSVFESPYGPMRSTDTSPLFVGDDVSFDEGSMSNAFPDLDDVAYMDARYHTSGLQTSPTGHPMSRNVSSTSEDMVNAAVSSNNRGPQTSYVTPMSRNESTSHAAIPMSRIASSSHPAVRMSRDASSPGQSYAQTPQQSPRLSSSSGISKQAKRKQKELKELEVDHSKPVEVKRAKNTLAARRSRAKREEHKEFLELEVERLRGERDHYKKLAEELGYEGPVSQE